MRYIMVDRGNCAYTKVMEMQSGFPADGPTPQKSARWAGNVALRFEAYDYAEPAFDIYTAIYDRLYLQGFERVVDVGSNDGKFVYLLNDRIRSGRLFSHRSRFAAEIIGVEPNAVAVDHLRKLNTGGLKFIKASAEDLPGRDKTVDVLTANFMMYFAKDIDACLREFLRVLKDDGKFVLSTSGYFNKVRQRAFEEISAERRGSKAPERMNKSFDTDIALETLPRYFANIYHGSYHGKMTFRSENEALSYYHSIMSMAEFFDPPMTDIEAEAACNEIVAPVVRREIEALGQFDDYIQRDFFICGNDAQGLKIYDPASDDIEIVTGYRAEQFGAAYTLAA